MKTLSRREQIYQETAEKILAIAREEMQRDGVAALSLGAIARKLGVRTPSLYTYFDSKTPFTMSCSSAGSWRLCAAWTNSSFKIGPRAET